eukprot:GDKI01020208.1.p1 GENE.GDKI01020208.1~~GDKI01020208.1.p1  ORF type:complete len:234 (+),score=41.27 GDKI01020208.1:215-916(+)
MAYFGLDWNPKNKRRDMIYEATDADIGEMNQDISNQGLRLAKEHFARIDQEYSTNNVYLQQEMYRVQQLEAFLANQVKGFNEKQLNAIQECVELAASGDQDYLARIKRFTPKMQQAFQQHWQAEEVKETVRNLQKYLETLEWKWNNAKASLDQWEASVSQSENALVKLREAEREETKRLEKRTDENKAKILRQLKDKKGPNTRARAVLGDESGRVEGGGVASQLYRATEFIFK